MVLTVGIDEVGYGPKLGPLVVASACADRRLSTRVRIADSKKMFSQARGVGALEPAVLGFLPAATFGELLTLLSASHPDVPWYKPSLPLPVVRRLKGLEGAFARLVDPAQFNAATVDRNKSDFLFDLVAELVNQIRRIHPGPIRFLVGKHGGRHYYLRQIQQQICPTVMVIEESPNRSTYRIPGATISFLKDAEDFHPLVALASMIGKYVRECAMKLFNDFWAGQREGLRRTAGYGRDATRFYREIEPALAALNLAPDAILRRR